MKPIRVAIIADYPEEGWPSMDLFAEMTLRYLGRDHAGAVEAVRVRPPYHARFGGLAPARFSRAARNVDRVLNRHVDYPAYLRALVRRGPFDAYHVVDHSYAHLVDALPAGRTLVYCHDLDAFRCLLGPDPEPRSAPFRALARRTLGGLRRAAVVAHGTEAVRASILEAGIVPEDRLRSVPHGVHPELLEPPDPAADRAVDALIGPADPGGPPDLLHVGTTIPRKRIDVLLDVFDGVRRARPGARLIKAGGRFTPEQEARARDLGILDSIRVMPFFDDRRTLAALYRRASVVLQPSDAEGFGLPLVEALATGVPLVVSDLPVFREVAGGAAVYRPVGDVGGWVAAVLDVLAERSNGLETWQSRRAEGLSRSAIFRWDTHASSLAAIYAELARTA